MVAETMSSVAEEVILGDVTLGSSEKPGEEEYTSCTALVVPTWVTAAFSETSVASISMVTLGVARLSSAVIFILGGDMVTGSKLVSNMSVVFIVPEVKREVARRGEEGLLPGSVE